jgi:hypothetical protein
MPNRRTFLKGMAAGAFAAPLLGRYGKLARAASPISTRPKRVLFFWNPQGANSGLGDDPFWPKGSETNFQLGRAMAPLEKHKSDLLILRGFHDTYFAGCRGTPNNGGDNGGIQDGEHGFGTKCRLTNTCPIPNPDDADLQWGGGISLDQELANVIGKDTLRPSLSLSGAGGSTQNHRGFLSYQGAGKPVTPSDNPGQVYSGLFGAATGVDASKADAIRAAKKSSLDLVIGDISALRSRLPTAERPKMDAHLEAVRILEREFDRALPVDCRKADPGYPAKLPSWGLNADPPSKHNLMMKTIAAAFACDLTRVACFMTASAGGDTLGDLHYFNGWPDNYHSTGHAAGGTQDGVSRSQAESLETMTQISVYYAKMLAELIDLLKATPEADGSGTLFDNTLIYWSAEMAHGNHGNFNIPHVIIGGKWHFATGRFLSLPSPAQYKDVADNKFGDILIAVANAMGHPITKFGRADWCGTPDNVARIRGV